MKTNVVKDFFKQMIDKLSIKDWAIIALALFALLMIMISSIYAHKYYDNKHKVVIWNDSTTIYKNKYNDEYLAKNTYILQVNQLKEYNKELYNEYKSLKDNPIVITKTDLKFKVDTVIAYIDSIKLNNDTISWNWIAQDSIYYTVNGRCMVKNDYSKVKTEIDNMEVNTEITLDVIDNGKQLEVIAKSDNPYINVDNIQSVVIDPSTSKTLKNYFKPKRWGFGPYLGFGLNAGADFQGKPQIGYGASIGLAIHFDIFQW